MFSSSKDRTAKIWDLNTGQEILSLNGHPNNVQKIRYCPNLNLIFTVSSSYVKVWDMRESPTKCIKTLSSSGLAIDGDLGIYRSTRTLQNEIPIGEHQINDIGLDRYGLRLYTAAGSTVKIWDLKQ
jgi:WD40 repeat protein